MPGAPIPYFDIAAAVIMCVTLASLLMRRLTSGAANRVYLSATALITVTTIAAVCAEAFGASGGLFPPTDLSGGEGGNPVRAWAVTIYFTLRAFSAPAYLIIIATVSDTTHRLNTGTLVRIVLWIPMFAMALLALTNPLHHLVFSLQGDFVIRGPGFLALYVEAAYYSVIGFAWLVRWQNLFSPIEFGTLILLYPVMLFAVVMQSLMPALRLELFVCSVALLLVSAFAIHPETRRDLLTNAESLQAYQEMCERAFMSDKHLCLVFIELVNIARLHELLGKDKVRDIVRDISAQLAGRLEGDDILYYLQDGLFCISPRNLDPDHAMGIARRAHEEGKAESVRRREKMPMTQMRTCIVRVPEDVSSPEALRAFLRRYAHLVPASDVTSFAELSKRDGFKLEMALTRIIRQAIRDRSFEVHYQPIMCLEDGRFHSAEALVRLNDPEFGWVSPGLFIPEAEQNGLIIDIGSILLQKIFAFLGSVDYERTGLHYVEANLSVEQCVRPGLADELLGYVKRYGVEPSCLNLEVTETSATFSQQIIEENVRKVAAAGITLSLDDYGTGYSNTARMLDLPFSLVKIDKTFVDGMDNPDTRTVLASTVKMLKDIGKDVLVEGVETAEQADALAAMGVDYIQGYYYAKPLPEAEFIAFLLEHNE